MASEVAAALTVLMNPECMDMASVAICRMRHGLWTLGLGMRIARDRLLKARKREVCRLMLGSMLLRWEMTCIMSESKAVTKDMQDSQPSGEVRKSF